MDTYAQDTLIVPPDPPPPTLTDAHREQLRASAIAPEIIIERGYRSIRPGDSFGVKHLAGGAFSERLLRTVLHAGALAFPIYRLGESQPYTWVLRPDLPRTTTEGKPVKYEWPKQTPNVLDTLPRYREALTDPAIPLCLIEGVKKTDSVASAYGARVVPVTLNGVFGWRTRNDKGGKAALTDFELIAWEGRTVWLFPDGDVRFNKQVQQAVQRLARLLTGRYGVAEVWALQLPMDAHGPKLGVDDFFAQGHTTDDLETHLTSLSTLARTARIPVGIHPDTGAKLFLPPGYDVRAQSMYRLDAQGNAHLLYSGGIYVKEVGVNLLTQEFNAVIAWNGRGNVHGEVTVPYAALSETRTFSQLVGAAGAALGPRNIKDVQQLLVEFAQENIDAIPRQQHCDRLGLVEGGVVLPAGPVGFATPVRYIGRPAISIGSDRTAYPSALITALGWGDAPVFWLTLGLSLTAPALARMHLRRNPVLYLSGESGSGKTTTIQFATGCYGDPTRHPFRIEAGRTTPAGIFQTLEGLGGLPMFVDEAHTVPEPKRLENACYGFANGQRYTVGSGDGRAKGGTPLDGTLFLAGEAIPEFKHAGSRLRVLWADASVWSPLGAAARSTEGRVRAALLEQAWEAGAGQLGHAVATHIWRDWAAFTGDVRTMEADAALVSLHAWRTPLAAAVAALNVALQVSGATVAHMPDAAAWVGRLLDAWATMLVNGHGDTDPAVEAWEAVITMLSQGRRHDDGGSDPNGEGYVPPSWEWIEADRGGGMIACRRTGDTHWRVLTATPQFKERIGPAAMQLYGQTWLKRGWIREGSDGKSTDLQRTPTGERVRIMAVPLGVLGGWSDGGVTDMTVCDAEV